MKPDSTEGSNPQSSPLDTHLVLNGLNRVASSFFAQTGQECDDLYAVAEYLALAMRLRETKRVSYAEESELLGKYLVLVNACKNDVLSIRVTTRNAEKLSIPPHLSCDVASCLLQALKVRECKNWSMDAVFDPSGVRLQLTPAVRLEPGNALPESVKRELQRLQVREQASFQIFASEDSDAPEASPQQAQQWSVFIQPVPAVAI